MPWQATHRISFTPKTGGHALHWLVMQCKDPYSQDYLVGLTEEEFAKEKVPSWRFRKDDGQWLWMGFPTPYGKAGSIVVDTLSLDLRPSTLRFARNRRQLHHQQQDDRKGL